MRRALLALALLVAAAHRIPQHANAGETWDAGRRSPITSAVTDDTDRLFENSLSVITQ